MQLTPTVRAVMSSGSSRFVLTECPSEKIPDYSGITDLLAKQTVFARIVSDMAFYALV